jgi:hypothetical protein
MSRIIRRDMLKVMAATAAGAAVTGTGIESVLAANPAPSPGGVMGVQPGAAVSSAPKIISATPSTSYISVPGSEFEAGGSTYTWNVIGPRKAATNGGFYFAPLDLPQGAVITECTFYLVNPTVAAVQCFIVYQALGSTGGLVFAATGTTTVTSTSVQALPLTMSNPLTVVDNFANWYDLDIENVVAVDNQIWGARVGWIHNPGLTLFSAPRRIVNGGVGATTMTSGVTYGPINSMLQFDGVTATGIPAGATAAFCAVQSYTPGVLTLFPDGATDPLIANYSGTGTQGASLNMVYMMVPLSTAGKFKIHSYITGKVYVDAWGYVF